ncbi:unnamed protein product [Fusarium langsethiae]|nr:unnamed protein product [Fusarium langsethiae]
MRRRKILNNEQTSKAQTRNQSSGFELVTVSLDDKPKYAALSYLWGKPEHYGKITIEGDTVKIPDNLASAFLCILSDEPFRSQSYCQYLWADAICIGQNDHEERSQQVQLMRRIFQLAHVTFAWITDQNTTRKSIAPNGLFDSEWLRGHPELCLNKELDLPNNHLSDPWFAVADFLQHQYWKRTWVFQEVVLADQLVFISPGGSNLAWSTLRGIGTNFIASMRDDMERPDFLISWLFLAQARTKIPDPDGFKGWIISTFAANLEATDHRDYIYGLLAVSDIPVSPNYSPENKASHVYTKYIAGWLKAARTQKTMHVHTPLVFLSLAGVGKFDTAMNLALLIAYFNQVPSDTVQKTWGSDWDRDILKLAFPTVDVTQFGIHSNILSELSSWDRQRRRDATFATVPLLYLYQFFETSEGYLGAVDYQVLEGDRLCALAGYNEAVILRPNANGSYAFVGSTSVIDIDADLVLQTQKAQSKWLDLQ